MASITQSQLQDIFTKADASGQKLDRSQIVQELVNRGHTIEGLNEPAKKMAQTNQQQVASQPKSFTGFLGNIASSTGNLIGGAVEGAVNVFNPDMEKNTVANVARLGIGGAANAVETLAGNEELFDAPGEELASRVGQFYKERYQSPQALWDTIYSDPAGFLSDAATLISGAGGALGLAGKLGGSAKLANAGATIAKAGIKAEPLVMAGRAVGKIAKGIPGVAKFATAQLSGLAPDTIATITGKPQVFKDAKAGIITRGSLAEKVRVAVEGKLDELSETGKGYEAIRKSGQTATLPGTGIDAIFRSHGITADKAGKLAVDLNSTPMGSGELAKLQAVYDMTRGMKRMTANEILNARKYLDNLSAWDSSNIGGGQRVARDLRSFIDEVAKDKITGLTELDAKYAPEVEYVRTIKKDFLESTIDPEGSRVYTLKDGAVSKIANLTGKGKEKLLQRVEQIVPGIRDEVMALKAMEDVTLAGGQKVGTYARGLTGGYLVSGGNPVGAILGAILSSPTVVVPILQKFAQARGFSSATVKKIIQKLKVGQNLTGEESALVALAIEDAERSMPNIPVAATTQPTE